MRTCCSAQAAVLSALRSPNGKETPKGADMHLCMADSLCHTAENTTLPSSCTPVKINCKKKGSRVCAASRAVHRGHQRLGWDSQAPAWGCARRHRCPPPPHPSAACRQHRSANSPDVTAATRGARGRDGPYLVSHLTPAQTCEKDRTLLVV